MEIIINMICKDLSLSLLSVKNTVSLLLDENTVPFIARYRKELTGNLDEVQIRDIERKLKYYQLVEERKKTILETIKMQDKLSPELEEKITECFVLSQLEDLYLPYKPKKKTRASIAKEKGLEPLAQIIMDESDIDSKVEAFINPEKNVNTSQDALNGAMDIVAEVMAEDFDIRNFTKEIVQKEGVIQTKAKEMKPNSDFDMYKDYKEPIPQIKPHRVLAINRAERLQEISVKLVFPDDEILTNIKNYFIIEENPYVIQAIEDGYKRLLKPSIEREARQTLNEKAETQAMTVFSENLKNLLLQPPLKGRVILGIDPGIRTGSKYAIISDVAEVLAYGVFDQKNFLASKTILAQLVKQHKVALIAIGNGTGNREVEKIVAELLQEQKGETQYAVVPETGASVYSASDAAREEFPDLDLTIRGAISIARRLQDPISEYVKIDPKSLGIGQYQHDVDQSLLSKELESVVVDSVNLVGVNLNTASYELLKYVSGLTPSLARKIALYRKMNGQFSNRLEIKKIKGVGDKAFEQCAGFLKIPQSSNPLDNTWVHPEQYDLASKILTFKTAQGRIVLTKEDKDLLKEEFQIKEITLKDIIESLEKPNMDPRDNLEAPLLKNDITDLKDLFKGMILKGTVRNVVDFGAFVDIGIKNDGLVHISEIADKFIKHPLDALQVGDIVDVVILEIDKERERVQLSIKQVKEIKS